MHAMGRLLQWFRGAGRRERTIAAATALAVVATIAAVAAFFPRSGVAAPTYEVRVPGPNGRLVGPLLTAPAWPGTALAVRGKHFTGQTATVSIGGDFAGRLPVQADGTFAGLVLVPEALPRGWHRFVVIDDGSGQEVVPRHGAVVVRGPPPYLWAGPTPLRGKTLLVAGAGFPPQAALHVLLDSALIGTVQVLGAGHLALAAEVPAGTSAGRHHVSVVDVTGVVLARVAMRVARAIH
jgi:hypothetical protein